MMPGVTYLPVPSMTSASAGALTVAPTAAIFPFCSRIAPLRISRSGCRKKIDVSDYGRARRERRVSARKRIGVRYRCPAEAHTGFSRVAAGSGRGLRVGACATGNCSCEQETE